MTRIDDTVRCRAGNIDRNLGRGEVGRVTGFARLSAYHPREVFVSSSPPAAWNGWFWELDVEPAD